MHSFGAITCYVNVHLTIRATQISTDSLNDSIVIFKVIMTTHVIPYINAMSSIVLEVTQQKRQTHSYEAALYFTHVYGLRHIGHC